MELNDTDSDDLPDVVISKPRTRRSRKLGTKKPRNTSSQINIDLPDDLKLSLKLEALQEDSTISDLVIYYLTTAESMPVYEVRKKRAA